MWQRLTEYTNVVLNQSVAAARRDTFRPEVRSAKIGHTLDIRRHTVSQTNSTAANDQAPRQHTLMLVDGYGLIFRAYHAVPPSLTTSKGEQVNAVFGFASMLLDVLRTQEPDYAIIALEGGRTFRHDAYDGYKANRGSMPEDLRRQVGRVREFVKALNVPVEERDGYEADDVIGSLSTRCAAEGNLRTLIVTGDSDLLQLVDDSVHVVLPGAKRFGELRLFDRSAVIDRYGFGPEHVPDYKALVGDTSDNIPGVPGIGDKTAKSLIGQFGTVEEILKHLDEVTPTRARQALAANSDQALESKRLALIVRDLDIGVDLEHSTVGNYDRDAIVNLFRELEFRTLLGRLPEPTLEAALHVDRAARMAPTRTIVRTPADLSRLVERVHAEGEFAVDVETTSTDPMVAELVGIAVAVSPAESYYVPLKHPPHASTDGPSPLTIEAVRQVLGPLFREPELRIFTHHGKYDLTVLRQHGFELFQLDDDTMIDAYLLGETSTRLKNLAFTRLGIEMTEITALIGSGRNQLTMDEVDSDLAGEYACGDVEATFELAEHLRPEIHQHGLDSLLRDIELPLVPVLVEMERAGIAIDVDYLYQLSTEITARMAELERDIHREAGRPININSTRQLATLLFDELKLASGRRTKTGFSVDSDVLEAIRAEHPIVEAIIEYRGLIKLKSTYVDALPLQVNARTGRVHTSYNQTVAATGRLSSTNPNLQNIPIRTEMGRRVRRAFVADHRPEFRLIENAVLLSADYSQIELRLIAHFSGEEFLVDAYRNDEDVHQATAAVVYAVPPEAVTPDMRRVAKTVNFGVLYGMQSYGLSRDTGLPRAEAQAFIDDYWARLPAVRRFLDETLRFGATHGYVLAQSGRRRVMPDLLSTNGGRRIAAERMAMNMPVQGAAADIIKVAMIRLDAALRQSELRGRLLLQVHDELILEVDERDVDAIATLVKDSMEHAADITVPLVTEVRTGPNWDDMRPIGKGSAVHGLDDEDA